MNLSVMEEEESCAEEDDENAEQAREQRMLQNETKMEVVYSKLISFKQFNQCYQFILAQVGDNSLDISKPRETKRFEVNTRVKWLMKAKTCLTWVEQSPQTKLTSERLKKLLQKLTTQLIILNKVIKISNGSSER